MVYAFEQTPRPYNKKKPLTEEEKKEAADNKKIHTTTREDIDECI